MLVGAGPARECQLSSGERPLVITVKLADGSEQTLDVESIRTTLDGAPIELSLNGTPALLRIFSPGNDQRWQRFVVHHSAANVMELEVRSHGKQAASAAG
jgi:hypothetical protein